jgi:hypothetical protein
MSEDTPDTIHCGGTVAVEKEGEGREKEPSNFDQ